MQSPRSTVPSNITLHSLVHTSHIDGSRNTAHPSNMCGGNSLTSFPSAVVALLAAFRLTRSENRLHQSRFWFSVENERSSGRGDVMALSHSLTHSSLPLSCTAPSSRWVGGTVLKVWSSFSMVALALVVDVS